MQQRVRFYRHDFVTNHPPYGLYVDPHGSRHGFLALPARWVVVGGLAVGVALTAFSLVPR